MKTKLFLLVFVAMLLPQVVFAQDSDEATATLQIGDQTSVFVGMNSYIQALNAAREAKQPSVITLSPNIFNGTDNRVPSNTKIIGMGYNENEEDGVKRTFIRGNMSIGEGETTENVHIEGVRIEGGIILFSDVCNKDTKIFRVRCGNIELRCNTDGLIIRETLMDQLYCYYGQTAVHTNMQVQNTILSRIYYMPSSAQVVFDHDVFVFDGRLAPFYYLNCIMRYCCNEGGIMNYCVFTNENTQLASVSGTGNYMGVDNATFWADGSQNMNWRENRWYELADPDSYPGSDGTQVGIYGGAYPYNRIPTTPRITKSEIDDRTSSEGKLHVNIEAQAQPVVE